MRRLVKSAQGKRIVREPVPIAKEEPLKLELQDFIKCVLEKETPERVKRVVEEYLRSNERVMEAKVGIGRLKRRFCTKTAIFCGRRRSLTRPGAGRSKCYAVPCPFRPISSRAA